tara:strand:+ start:49 stop:714 length:666 start_codon:yes stop_codon:yes gene_type:complete
MAAVHENQSTNIPAEGMQCDPQNVLTGNEKRIQSCKKVGGKHKKDGHDKEGTFNEKYNPEWKGTISTKAEADCEISHDHEILKILKEKGIIDNMEQRHTSNKSGGSIQLTLGNIPELSKDDNLEWIKENSMTLLNKYFKKVGSSKPSDLLVYDTGNSRLFFNMDRVIKFMEDNCEFRKLKSGRIKGDFKDECSRTGKRALLTYEYNKKKKILFLRFLRWSR